MGADRNRLPFLGRRPSPWARSRLRLALLFGGVVGAVALLLVVLLTIAVERMIVRHETTELARLAADWIDRRRETGGQPTFDVRTEATDYGALRHHFYLWTDRLPPRDMPEPAGTEGSRAANDRRPEFGVGSPAALEPTAPLAGAATAAWVLRTVPETPTAGQLLWLLYPTSERPQAVYAALAVPAFGGWLIVGEETSDYYFLLRELKGRAGGLALVALLLSAVVGYVLAGLALRPLLDARERERRFTANAAHELRTPLSVIGAALEVLEEIRPDWPPFYQDVFRDLGDEVTRLQRTADGLLWLARRETEAPREKRPVDLRTLARDAVRRFRPLAEARGLELVFHEKARETTREPATASADPPASGAWVLGDRDDLMRLFGNLLDNAIKYTPAPGRIDVDLAETAEAVVLTVADTGPGMDAETVERLFDRFYRGSAAGSGSGLGMNIVRAIVEDHGGAIDVDSAPGQGTRILVRLPRAEPAPDPSRASAR
ncbi:HAMP domain-containing sensor histidine kinase [Hydrogenibacillus sp. N12]|uniref:sensor histidine kinase n=1 Tax=Hydrogenibacillus sp. N12 TaxID=2866627 RepID=UPI001C7DFE7A|nr:HAMP domain-containing sensor histidine kinase [Hydrogenibacillus sp. N12]QZA32255.1 HAMP domain-containing histidine kinase [Hydrogenibacillus sp. N12]